MEWGQGCIWDWGEEGQGWACTVPYCLAQLGGTPPAPELLPVAGSPKEKPSFLAVGKTEGPGGEVRDGGLRGSEASLDWRGEEVELFLLCNDRLRREA